MWVSEIFSNCNELKLFVENTRSSSCFFLKVYIILHSSYLLICSISFPLQLLELTENYTPEVSEYKVGLSTASTDKLYLEPQKKWFCLEVPPYASVKKTCPAFCLSPQTLMHLRLHAFSSNFQAATRNSFVPVSINTRIARQTNVWY